MNEPLTRPDDWDEPVMLPEIRSIQRVLVPFDGSHCAERALAWSVLLATTASAEVVVMVAFEPPLTKRGRGSDYVEAMRTALDEEARQLATEAVQLLLDRGCRARGIVIAGEPAASALDTAESEDCNVIVIGRRGLSSETAGLAGALERFRSAMQGGVAEKVARHAEIPVMVVT